MTAFLAKKEYKSASLSHIYLFLASYVMSSVSQIAVRKSQVPAISSANLPSSTEKQLPALLQTEKSALPVSFKDSFELTDHLICGVFKAAQEHHAARQFGVNLRNLENVIATKGLVDELDMEDQIREQEENDLQMKRQKSWLVHELWESRKIRNSYSPEDGFCRKFTREFSSENRANGTKFQSRKQTIAKADLIQDAKRYNETIKELMEHDIIHDWSHHRKIVIALQSTPESRHVIGGLLKFYFQEFEPDMVLAFEPRIILSNQTDLPKHLIKSLEYYLDIHE